MGSEKVRLTNIILQKNKSCEFAIVVMIEIF